MAAFLFLLGVGWVALSHLKAEMVSRRAINPVSSAAAPTQPGGKSPLVYSAPGDRVHYHASTHLPPKCDRTALSQEAALLRGLKPCPICFKK